MNQDEKYMKAAIRQAKKAYALDEGECNRRLGQQLAGS